jgi:ABC-type bacteriocin/lantibiotic exporter with double-glycine peptidase domain
LKPVGCKLSTSGLLQMTQILSRQETVIVAQLKEGPAVRTWVDRVVPLVTSLKDVPKGPPIATPEKPLSLVEFEDVTFRFGEKMIFDRLNFEIRSGERLALLGPSGIGKSTLLRLLLRILDPGGGRILYNGVDIAGLKHAQLSDCARKSAWSFSLLR